MRIEVIRVDARLLAKDRKVGDAVVRSGDLITVGLVRLPYGRTHPNLSEMRISTLSTRFGIGDNDANARERLKRESFSSDSLCLFRIDTVNLLI